jgi:hypothetical protein
VGERPGIDTSVPHEARVYDYWLGGKDNYAPDREFGDLIREQVPTIGTMARANRDFLVRAVRHLAEEAGIRQFLDLGTGLPTAPNVHQVAQAVDPSVRVLYVDNNPVVISHGRALVSSTPEGRAVYMLGDLLDPDGILGSDQLRETLDLGEPVGLLLITVLMYLDPDDGRDPYPAVERLVDALPSGSYVAITHPTGDFDRRGMAGVRLVAKRAGMTILPRDQAAVARFFGDTKLVDPGIVPVVAWRPDPGSEPVDPQSVYYWAGVSRKL